MRKIIVIAVREYQAAVRTKAFIVSVVAMPVMMGGSIAAQLFLRDKVDTTDKRIAVLDSSAVLYDSIAEVASQRNETDIFEGEGSDRKKTKPRFLIEKAQVEASDPQRVIYELSERVRDREIFAFLVIGADVVTGDGRSPEQSIAYHSNSPAYGDFLDWVVGPIQRRIQALRLTAANLDPTLVRQAIRPTPIADLGLVSLDEQGRVTEAERTNKIATFAVPMAMMMLMFLVVMVGASPLTQIVIEEKMNRIAEVLLGSVPPFQLMMGKLLGTVGVSLTLAIIYLAGGYYALVRVGYGSLFPAHLVGWFVVFQCLAVLLYGSVFIAVGAAVTDLKEAQSLMMPVMLIVVAPMFVWMNVLKEPTAAFSVALSLFPPATPMLMTLRQSVPPGVPLWQPLLGVVLVLLSTVACVFVAGRIFRVGILMQGKGAKVGELMRWVVRG